MLYIIAYHWCLLDTRRYIILTLFECIILIDRLYKRYGNVVMIDFILPGHILVTFNYNYNQF